MQDWKTDLMTALQGATTEWVPANVTNIASTVMFCCGGVVQLLAGMYEFDRNNMFAATALTSVRDHAAAMLISCHCKCSIAARSISLMTSCYPGNSPLINLCSCCSTEVSG